MVPRRRLIHILAGHIIGTGSYGHVYRGCLQGVSVAIKRIIRDTSPVADEVCASVALDHPNLVKSYVVYIRSASDSLKGVESGLDSIHVNCIDPGCEKPHDRELCNSPSLGRWSSLSSDDSSALECFIVQACSHQADKRILL